MRRIVARRRWFLLRIAAALACLLVSGYALYANFFFAWVATAGDDEAHRELARSYATIWSFVSYGAAALFLGLAAWTILDVVQRVRRRSEVTQQSVSLRRLL